MADQHNAMAATVHGMRDQVGTMVLSQQALQAHVDNIHTGLASVVEAQQASTAATHDLGAQIQQLLGHFSLMGPSGPPGLGTPKGNAPAASPMDTAPTQAATGDAPPAPAADQGGELQPPAKAAGKGTQPGAGAYAPC